MSTATARSADGTTPSPDDWLRTRAAAAYLGVSTGYLSRLASQRVIRHRRVGRSWEFQIRDLDAYADSKVVEPQTFTPPASGRPRAS